MLNQNLHSYFVLRNQKFTIEFKKFRKNSKLNMAAVPYFCANLYMSIFKKAFPKVAKSFDEVQKNHAETIFFNTHSHFDILKQNIRGDLSLKDYLQVQQKHIEQERDDLEWIMSSDKHQLYRLFDRDFSLLPFTLSQKRLQDLLKFMKFYSD